MIMVVFLPTPAFSMLVVMAASAFFMIVVMFMPAAAPFVLVVVAAPTALMMVVFVLLLMAVMVPVPLMDLGIRFHRPGDPGQLFDQRVGILRRQMQLPGCKGDGRLLHFRQGVEFIFDLRRAVGAVQILDGVDLFRHDVLLFKSIYEHSFMCYNQYNPISRLCQ